MTFSVGNGFLTSSISKERIQHIYNSKDERAACAMSLWAKIKDYFFKTHEKQALTLLHKLVHAKHSSDAVSYFFQLRDLASDAHQHKFTIDADENKAALYIDDYNVFPQSDNSTKALSDLTACISNNYSLNIKEIKTVLMSDLEKSAYTFQSHGGEKHQYNLSGQKCSKLLCNEITGKVMHISDQKKYKTMQTLLLNTQNVFSALNSVIRQHDKKFPVLEEGMKVLSQKYHTHSQSNDDVIIQQYKSFLINPDQGYINKHKAISNDTPPYSGKVNLHAVWLVKNYTMQAIGMNLEVTSQ